MIVIPMAGLSKRFTDAGYRQPKYELPLAGRTVFDWAMMSFERYFQDERFVIVALERPGLKAFVDERREALGLRRAELVLLDAPTRGQAETVALGLSRVSAADDEPVVVFNIDTLRPNLILPDSGALSSADGYLETFQAAGEHWSFVEPAAPGDSRVARVAEKKRISDHCCTGLYSFRTLALYNEAYRAECAAPSSFELFVAPMYNHLIARGAMVRYADIRPDEILFCGTPSEYEDLKSREIDVLRAYTRRDAGRPVG